MAYEGAIQSIPGAVASGDLSSDQFKFVVQSSTGIAKNTSAGGIVDGVLQNAPNAIDQPANVAFAGVTKVLAAAGGIAKGANVMSDANGKAVTATTAVNRAGRALEAATADGDIISILLGSGWIPAP
jgi:hypothetical protein